MKFMTNNNNNSLKTKNTELTHKLRDLEKDNLFLKIENEKQEYKIKKLKEEIQTLKKFRRFLQQ